MSGNTPNILIILLAVVTYGALAFVVMRFALRDARPEAGGAGGARRPRAIPVRSVEPESVLSALEREPSGDVPREMQRSPAPRVGPPQARGSLGGG